MTGSITARWTPQPTVNRPRALRRTRLAAVLVVLALALALAAPGPAAQRLYRLRYLHRGTHRPPTAIEFVRALRLSLCPPRCLDTS